MKIQWLSCHFTDALYLLDLIMDDEVGVYTSPAQPTFIIVGAYRTSKSSDSASVSELFGKVNLISLEGIFFVVLTSCFVSLFRILRPFGIC